MHFSLSYSFAGFLHQCRDVREYFLPLLIDYESEIFSPLDIVLVCVSWEAGWVTLWTNWTCCPCQELKAQAVEILVGKNSNIVVDCQTNIFPHFLTKLISKVILVLQLFKINLILMNLNSIQFILSGVPDGTAVRGWWAVHLSRFNFFFFPSIFFVCFFFFPYFFEFSFNFEFSFSFYFYIWAVHLSRSHLCFLFLFYFYLFFTLFL